MMLQTHNNRSFVSASDGSGEELTPSDKNGHPLAVLLVGYMHGSGGIQNHTHWFATGLAEDGHEVHVATPAPMHGDTDELPTTELYSVQRAYSLFSLANLRPQTKSHFDTAIVAGTGWKAMLGVALNRRIRKRIFFEVMSGDRDRLCDPRILASYRFDMIVGQATPVTHRFCQEFNWDGRVDTVPALPEPLERTAEVGKPRHRNAGQQRLKACYFGRLAAHKGVEWMLDKWSDLEQYVQSLDIHGIGPEESRIRQKINEMGAADSIRMHGRYPTGQAYVDLLKSYDVMLLPTVGQEGAPLVLLEAMACGLPFIANGVGGISDYSNPNCEVTSGDITEFAGKLGGFHSRWVREEISGIAIQEFYFDHFSSQALTERWVSCIRQASGRR